MRGNPLAIAFVCLTATLGMAGCNGSGDGDDIFIGDIVVDNFPGGSIQDNNLADDRRAFSNNERDFQTLRCVANGSTGNAIVLFTTTGDATGLWASYSTGGTLTPPVELRAQDADYTQPPSINEVVVLFLNTRTNANANAQARDGDAIILYRRQDIASGGNDGANVALFASYFDASFAGDPARRFGFDAATGLGQRLDGAVGNTFQDAAGESVARHGIISDGFRGRTFATADAPAFTFDCGDAVTFNPVAVWIQADNGAQETLPNDNRFLFRVLDIEAADSTTLTALAAGEVPFAPADQPTQETSPANRDDTQLVSGGFVTYDNVLFFQQIDGNPAASGNPNLGVNNVEDRTLVFNRVDPTPSNRANPFETNSTPLTPGSGGVGTPDGNNGINEGHQNVFHPNAFFGPDDGLASQVLVFFAASSSTAGDDPDLFVAQVNPTEPFEAFDAATDRVQVTVDGNGTGLDGFTFADLEDATNGVARRGATKHQERLARNKTYVATAFRQTIDGGGRTVLRVATVDTNLSATGSLPALSVATPVTISNDSVQDVTAYQFQDELDGEKVQSIAARANVTDTPQQSEPNTMFLLFEESEVSTNDDQLFARGFRFAGRGAAPTLVGSAAVEIPGGQTDGDFENGEITGVFAANGNRRFPSNKVFATDNGLDSGGNARLVVVYIRDQSSTTTDLHLVAAEVNSNVLGEVVQIDSNNADRDVSAFFALTVATDRFTGGDDSFSGNRLHILFLEDRINSTSQDALRSRVLDKTVRNTTSGVALANEFLPVASQAPFTIDFDIDDSPTLPTLAPAMTASIAHAGETVAVYFVQDDHLYYNEFNGASWITESGVSAPQLIDNDDEARELVSFVGLCPIVDLNLNDLSGALVFFSRFDLDGRTRLYARRHN